MQRNGHPRGRWAAKMAREMSVRRGVVPDHVGTPVFDDGALVLADPLASAAALRAMLALPAGYRQRDGMIRGIIERNWPELLELPINRYGDRRDVGPASPSSPTPGACGVSCASLLAEAPTRRLPPSQQAETNVPWSR